MTTTRGLMLETAPAVLAFAAVFVAGEHIHPLRPWIPDRRGLVSFAAGTSAAYVFVHMMPELHEARLLLQEAASESVQLRYEGIAVYFIALIGFLCFYGLDRIRARSGAAGEQVRDTASERLHIGGMAAYVALMSYLLVRSAGNSIAATVLYTLAFGGHFLALDHSLREEYGANYQRSGRWLMAGSCVLGWAAGLALPLPEFALALVMAFISGGVIMTNTIMELSEGKEGRFLPFATGAVLYGLMLVPLG